MQTNKKIFITNDDGIHAPGIRQLYRALEGYGELTVVAPMQEQSATSLSITLRSPLRIEEVQWDEKTTVYSINGTPADCVKLGLHAFHKPDLIISGINRGSNAGRNVLYSGTVACAIEGVLHGIPSIAFSCYDYWETSYAHTVEHIQKIVQHIAHHPLPKGTLLNVNFPSQSLPKIVGYKMTRQGRQYWAENPTERSHPAERHAYYWLGAKLMEFDEEEDCDISWLKKGYVTAVPVHIDQLTDTRHLQENRHNFDSLFGS